MSDSNSPDLVKVTELFLVPSSFLVAALGTADSNPHRALCSVLGLLVSLLWLTCAGDAMADIAAVGTPSRRHQLLKTLSIVFVGGWLLSSVVHFYLWSRPLGQV